MSNGIVSVVRNNEVVIKVVSGSNSCYAVRLAYYLLAVRADIGTDRLDMADILTHSMKMCNFGCETDLVVQRILAGETTHASFGLDTASKKAVSLKEKDEEDETYASQAAFRDPLFNPRWKRGTFDHVFVVNLDDLSIENGDLQETQAKYASLKHVFVSDSPVIPSHEQKNVLDTLWVLLQDCESRAWSQNDPVLKHQVTQSYDLLNRLGYTKERPRLEKQKAQE